MTVFIIRRMLQALLVVCLMSVIVFFGVNIVGDPLYMLVSPDADQADIEAAIARLGLDRPIWEQYVLFLKGAAQDRFGFAAGVHLGVVEEIAARLAGSVDAVACETGVELVTEGDPAAEGQDAHAQTGRTEASVLHVRIDVGG